LLVYVFQLMNRINYVLNDEGKAARWHIRAGVERERVPTREKEGRVGSARKKKVRLGI
jgi:hypothetical protein